MQTADAVVRVQALDGTWETIGVDRARGITAQDLQLNANDWGSDTAGFKLRRSAGALWPDLTAFTPVEIEIAGVVVWSGFVSQTPTTDADGDSVDVQCKGWQYHLDDDTFEKVWIHSSLPDWRDARTFGAYNANLFRGGPTASTDDGSITLGWPNGTGIIAGTYVGVILDLGPENKASAASVTWEVPTPAVGASAVQLATSSNIEVYMIATDSVASINTSNAAYAATQMGALGSATTRSGTFPTPGRYVLLALRFKGTTAAAVSSDYIVKIRNASVATDTGKYTGSASASLKGQITSDAVKDIIPYAPRLSTSTAKITSTTFDTPHLGAVNGGKSPREYLQAINAFHDYQIKVDPDRVVSFAPRPTSPSLAIGSWGGAPFTDAAANSADEIYNKVIVEGNGPDGEVLRVATHASAVRTGSSYSVPATDWITNPDFSSGNATGWTQSLSALTVTSGTPVGSGNYLAWGDFQSGATPSEGTLTGTLVSGKTFRYGTTYTLSFLIRPDVYLNYGTAKIVALPKVTFGTSSDFALVPAQLVSEEATGGASPSTYTLSLSWTPKADRSSSDVTIKLDASGWNFTGDDVFGIDSFTLSYTNSMTSLPDRRNFTRSKRIQTSFPITEVTAHQIGESYLRTHADIPLKGTITVSSGGVRRYSSGALVHPAHLLLEVGQLVHLSHRIDPSTGAQGRDGQVATVSYSHAQQSAEVAIDNDRGRFETLLERLSVVTSNRLGR